MAILIWGQYKIVGYESPELACRDSLTWLIVSVAIIVQNEVIFTAEDPALTVSELVDLRDWFESLQTSEKGLKPLYFTEPCLYFASDSKNVVSVGLSDELHPKGKKHSDRHNPVMLKLNLTYEQIWDTVMELDMLVNKYKVRQSRQNRRRQKDQFIL